MEEIASSGHPETFGHWVRERRKVLSLTQADLGRLVSCSKVMINKIEGNQRRPSVQMTRLLLRYLKIDPKLRIPFVRLARPELNAQQIDEIAAPYTRAPGQPAARRPSNLPVPLTPLVGRTQEVAAICSLLLDPDVRLVTLTGAGGMGKTRLALQAAAELAEQFVDGCRFVPLSALESPEALTATVARGLGIKEDRERTLEQALLHWLADKDILIVLDNFEQIIRAAKKVAELLASSPGLKVLITSRTVLHLSGEYEFVVPPLRFVEAQNSLSSEELIGSPAVALFVQKARAVRTDFALTPENSAVVARICARLDGLPLAIELAASRSKFLSPAGLLARLEGSAPDGPLDVLSGGAQDLPARQQTMRQAVDWSYNLLNRDEQDLFRQLAVFVGGCTPEAAGAVCADTGTELLVFPPAPHSARAIANRLAALVDQSMLQQTRTPDGEPRFGMLETLREYALERLAARGKEWAVLRRRHARYFMALAESAEPMFEGAYQAAWLDRLEREHDNLQAALAWCCGSPEDAEVGLKLAGALWQFWLIRGYVNEGRLWFARLLAQAPAAPALVRARALNGAGFLHWAWSDYDQAEARLNESLALYRELGDTHGAAWVLNHLCHVAVAREEWEKALELVRESLGMFRSLGADWNIAWNLLNLADIYRLQGDPRRAAAHYDESLELFRKVGDPRGTAWNLDHLGRLAHAAGDHARAMALLSESLGLFRGLGDKRSTAWVLSHLAAVALASDRPDLAQGFMDESQALFKEIVSLVGGNE
jgi:predicted ATPase/transcriptional regulator with XRE-family HTH domain